MIVGSRALTSQIPQNTCLRVGGTNIVPSSSLKNLGLCFDAHMTFDAHINHISRKVFSTIVYINRMKNNFNCNSRIIVVQSLVLSIINFGIRIWGTANTTRLQQIQKLQNFAAKVALGGGAKHDRATPFIKELGWLKVREKYKHELGIMMHNVMRGNVPSYLFPLPRVRDVRAVTTRQQDQLYVPSTNTNTGARSMLVDEPKFWNSLPSEIRGSQSIRSFKSQLMSHLLNEQFNT